MHGLNMYDYAARYMDPAMGRFSSVDPHAENYFSWSPYAYVLNNPMKYIDPDGKQVQIPFNPATQRAFWVMKMRKETGYKGETVANELKYLVSRVTPDAVALEANIKTQAIVGVEGKVGFTYAIKGADSGKIRGKAAGGFLIGTDISIGAGVKGEVINATNSKEFKLKDVEGPSKEASIDFSFKKIGNASLSKSEGKSDMSGTINSYGAGIGVGVSAKESLGKGWDFVKAIGGNLGIDITKNFHNHKIKANEN